MRRGWAVLALGLGLLAASAGRAGDGPEPVPPPKPLPGNAANGGNGGAPGGPALTSPPNGGNHGAPCGGCCGHGHRSCLRQLVDFFTYRALPVPSCCRQCPCHCHWACSCLPPAYVLFLGERCHEGHYYGSACGHCGGCGCGASAPTPGPGVIPPPGEPLTGVVPPPPVPYPAQGEPQKALPPPAHP
jgi:hypothetical protein